MVRTVDETVKTRVIGQSRGLIYSEEKISGVLHFVADMKLQGELHAKVLRSPYPHAYIKDIDIDAARRMHGVRSVITGRDVPRKKYGVFIPDETILAQDKVRYAGEEVVAVAAETEEIALEALQKVKVTYEPIEAVFDPLAASESNAPLVHENFPGNIASVVNVDRGDVSSAWKECDVIVQETFKTGVQHQAYLEPFGCVAYVEDDGKVVVFAPVQDPHITRSQLAKALGLSISSIRVIQSPVGGSFGGKAHPSKPSYICAKLALETRRPVKMVNTCEEEFLAGRPRQGWTITMKLGASKDGTFLAEETDIVGNNGAYTAYAIAPLQIVSIRNDSIYRINNIKTRAKLVYTNTVPTGAMRGIGNTQSTFALESLVDEIARRLSLDPIDLRLKNAHHAGDVSVHGWKIESCGLDECLGHIRSVRAQCAERETVKSNGRKTRTGYGIAAGIHVSSNRGIRPSDATTVMIRVNEDGKVNVYVSEVDVGQGLPTVLAMIVSEELGIKTDDVIVSPRVDTDISLFGWGTGSDRCTLLTGNAARIAAQKAKELILKEAGEFLDSDAGALAIVEGIISVVKEPERSCTFAEAAHRAVYKRNGAHIVAVGTYDPPTTAFDPSWYGNPHPGLTYSAQLAEVEVDTETGQIEVKRVVSAHDVGRAINPRACRGQIQGAVLQGMGFALFEDINISETTGIPLNKNFSDYRIPSLLDAPTIHPILVESHLHPSGPFGAKGVGQDGLVPILAAIGNAIYDATGLRITKVPMKKEDIWRQLLGAWVKD